MFPFFKKPSDPLTRCLISESWFRGRTACREGKTGDMMVQRRMERERPFILSDKETSWIGGYHTPNWTSSLCLAGHWKWTTGMCQLATKPSTSPVHSCYQPPTISLPLSLSLFHLHPPGLVLPPFPFSPPSLSFLVYTWHPVLSLSISTSYSSSVFLRFNPSVSLSSPLHEFPCVFSPFL